MAETESTIPQAPLSEAAAVPIQGVPVKKERVSVALSEENLAAFLGAETSGRRPVAPAPASEVPVMLELLSEAQEKPHMAQARPVPAPPLAETTENTLALIAAIKENRAELLRSRPSVKPATIPPLPVKAALEPAAAPAPRSRGTVFPASAPPPAPIPAWAMPRPSSPSRLAAALHKMPGGGKSLLILGAVIAIGGISAGLVLRNQRTAKANTTATAPAPVVTPAAASGNTFPLQLRAEVQSNGSIDLRWNPQSALIAQAREGRLVATEANQTARTIAIALDQLKSGHSSYQPRSERVEFRLEVVDQSGSIAEESALALAPPAAGKAENPSPQPIPPLETPVVTADQPALLSRPPSRIFTPPAAQPVAEQHPIVDIPPALPNMAVPSLGTSGQMPRALAAPPSPPPTPAPAPAPRQIQVADTLQAANLIKRVAPAYPPLAKAAHLEGTVRFQAIIGTNGAIRNLEVLGGPPLLRPAAIDAVRQWVYRPTLLNGQPLEVVTQIEVAFKLGQ